MNVTPPWHSDPLTSDSTHTLVLLIQTLCWWVERTEDAKESEVRFLNTRLSAYFPRTDSCYRLKPAAAHLTPTVTEAVFTYTVQTTLLGEIELRQEIGTVMLLNDMIFFLSVLTRSQLVSPFLTGPTVFNTDCILHLSDFIIKPKEQHCFS